MSKLALILTGGGMKASYSVGVVLALVKEFNLKSPDIVIAGSGSAGTASYYVAEQYDSIRNIWGNLLSTKKFIDFKRLNKIINIDYLIDDVFKKQDKLNEEKVYSSNIEYLISLTNYKTGNIEFYSNYSYSNIFEVMRATKAMPIVYGKKIILNGEKYVDTFISSIGIHTKINEALMKGAKKIIIVSSSNFDENLNVKQKGNGYKLFNLWFKTQNSLFKLNYEKLKRFEEKEHFYKGIKILILNPHKDLDIGLLDNNKLKLNNAINQGYNETKNNKELVKFFN